MEHAPVALQALKLGTLHYDKVKNEAVREFGKKPKEDPHVIDDRLMEEKGYTLRRRSQVRSDEEIVEVVRHKGEVLPRRPRNRRRTSSMNGSSRQGGYRRDAGGYGSESEGSVPPRDRRARAKSATGRRRDRSSSTSSTSSSQLGSSTDEEHNIKKMQRKKWLAAGFATIASIHAGSKVYSNVQAHDKRVISVAKGEISPEEAHQQARKSRWQDAAALGLAALGIKGAISEWKEMAEEHKEHKEMCEKHEEMHKRRLEHQRKKKAKESGGYYKGRDGYWYYDGPAPQDSERRGSRRNASTSTWDTYDQARGPRNMIDGPRDRKMIEAAPSRNRSRSVYNDRDRSRARSSYGGRGRDNDSDSQSPVRAKSRKRDSSGDRRQSVFQNPMVIAAIAAPFLAAGAYKITEKEIANEPFMKVHQEQIEQDQADYLQEHKKGRHETYKDFGGDMLEEVLEHVV